MFIPAVQELPIRSSRLLLRQAEPRPRRLRHSLVERVLVSKSCPKSRQFNRLPPCRTSTTVLNLLHKAPYALAPGQSGIAQYVRHFVIDCLEVSLSTCAEFASVIVTHQHSLHEISDRGVRYFIVMLGIAPVSGRPPQFVCLGNVSMLEMLDQLPGETLNIVELLAEGQACQRPLRHRGVLPWGNRAGTLSIRTRR